LKQKCALVIAAHPDDEVLGCAGTVAELCAQGWEVHHLILAEGAASRLLTAGERGCVSSEISALQQSAKKAANALGVRSVEFGDFPDNRMDGVNLLDIVKRIESTIESLRPIRVYTHQAWDVNVDHRIVHEAVAAATRPTPGHPVQQLLYFEVPSSTEWRTSGAPMAFYPNYFVDISKRLDIKRHALEAYASEMRTFPHPRSVQAVMHLAAWRGSTVGVAAAEAFQVGRWIE
jgi:LmbE family N-acetylglucosaminyl deacetylase